MFRVSVFRQVMGLCTVLCVTSGSIFPVEIQQDDEVIAGSSFKWL